MVNPLHILHTGLQTFVMDDYDGPEGMDDSTSQHRLSVSPPQVPFSSLDQQWQQTIGYKAFQLNNTKCCAEIEDQSESSSLRTCSTTKPLPIPKRTLKENIRPLRINSEPKPIKATEPVKSNFLRPHMALAISSQHISCEPKNPLGLAMAVFATNSFNDKEIRYMRYHAALTLKRCVKAKIQADLYRRRCAKIAVFILPSPFHRKPKVVLATDAKKVTIGFNPARLPLQSQDSSDSDSGSSYPDFRI